MNENKNRNQHARNWLYDNKDVIKAGITCGLIGFAYGFVKGVTTANRLWLNHDVTYMDSNIRQ